MNKLKDRVDEFERDLIFQAIKKAKSVNQASKILGCGRTTLTMKLKKYEINFYEEKKKQKENV